MASGNPASGIAVCLVAALGGWAAALLGMPLAWVLAPMAVTAAAAFSGIGILEMQPGRKIGQLIVGSAIGLTMTPAAIRMLIEWFSVMILGALVAIMLTGLLASPFARLARVNLATGFFALTPGGLSEMARMGEQEGAISEFVTVAQALRVAILVSLLPVLLLHFAAVGKSVTGIEPPVLPASAFLCVLAVSGLAVFLVKLMRANNPWMIGGLLGAGLLAGFDLVQGRAPHLPFIAGQYMIGITIGARFKRRNLIGAGRMLIIAPLFILLMSGLLACYALGMHQLTGLPVATAILAASPGGMAEMALTAKILQLNVVLVTAFHFVRSFIVNAYCLQFFRLFRRLGLFKLTEKICDRVGLPRKKG